MDKKASRLRRAAKTRARISSLGVARLAVFRSNCHIYAQLFSACGSKVLASASTVEPSIRSQLSNGGNVKAAEFVGKIIGERATNLGIREVAFDRSGFKYHGRVRALAEAARQAGLKF